MMISNKELFYSLYKEYNLTISLQTDFVIHAIIPTTYVVGDFILEYNISKDSLYASQYNQHIFLFLVSQFSPKLFKLLCLKYNRLVKELKDIEIQ